MTASTAALDRRPEWRTFLTLAAGIAVIDQLTKALLISSLGPGESRPVIGDYLRVVHGQNSGALFGMFRDNAALFGVVALGVIGLIVLYHARSGRSPYLSMTLGLLLGGAIGNVIDRFRHGYVVDWIDAGIGTLRWYTFNVADAAVSFAILFLLLAAIRPSLAEPASATATARPDDGDERDDEDGRADG